MNDELTLDEKEELKLTARGLRTNERLQHNPAALASLIEKGLLRTVGVGVKLTPKGEEMLLRL